MNVSRPGTLFLASLIGLAVTGAGLLLSIPALFRSQEPWRVAVAAVLGCLAVVCALGTRYWGPATRYTRPYEPYSDRPGSSA